MDKILVIGDSCKDVHVYGKCDRMCPDAPVPVFVPTITRENLGMAGNVYQNIISLGYEADLKTNEVIIEKKRFVQEATNHMFLRVDSGEEHIKRVKNLTKELLSQYDIIVISDYNKGFLLKKDIKFICDNHKNVFIDTKKKINNFCRNAKFIKINSIEYNNSLEYIEANEWTKSKIIQTCGSEGCKLADKTYPVEKVEIKDVCGAGDTFLASLCVKFQQTGDIEQSIRFANECASIVVQLKGVNTVGKF
jgi:D-beta-D-heptose 7-phosphate kinase/D-beta-D-heptose 1-phosphate adenosyltransferase